MQIFLCAWQSGSCSVLTMDWLTGKQDKELRQMAAQVQHLMASLQDIEALATAVKADAAASCKVSLQANLARTTQLYGACFSL